MWCSNSEEEEKEKIIPTSKSDTEKYKVSRTLSFLRSRMVNTKIKSKVRERKTVKVKWNKRHTEKI